MAMQMMLQRPITIERPIYERPQGLLQELHQQTKNKSTLSLFVELLFGNGRWRVTLPVLVVLFLLNLLGEILKPKTLAPTGQKTLPPPAAINREASSVKSSSLSGSSVRSSCITSSAPVSAGLPRWGENRSFKRQ
jgi:hypothetical protein